MDIWNVLAAIGGGLVPILIGLGYIIRIVRQVRSKMEAFRDDWYGDPPRPGYPGRPGVLQRLSTVEDTLAGHLASHTTIIRSDTT